MKRLSIIFVIQFCNQGERIETEWQLIIFDMNYEFLYSKAAAGL